MLLHECMMGQGEEGMDSLLNGFVARSREILRDDLIGIYLHGSAVMGCFNPAKSDLDVIVVVRSPLSDAVKKAYMDMVVAASASGPAKGIEMSIVTFDACRPFVYPTPYELHFSMGHLDRYRKDPERYILEMKGTDRDLAAHFTILEKRGRCLYGPPIRDVFDEVPKQAYLDSIWYDIEDAPADISEHPMYMTLNLARVAAYAEEGLVLSKKEGGEWALANVPKAYAPLIRDALGEYTENAEVAYDAGLAEEYAGYMLDRIRPQKGERA